MTKKYSHIFISTNKRTILLNPYRHYGSVIDNEDRSYHLNSSIHYTKSSFYTENFSKYYDTKFIDDSTRPNNFIRSIDDLFSDEDDDF
jgi:hypothetical protein